jgi:hypothetical protein
MSLELVRNTPESPLNVGDLVRRVWTLSSKLFQGDPGASEIGQNGTIRHFISVDLALEDPEFDWVRVEGTMRKNRDESVAAEARHPGQPAPNAAALQFDLYCDSKNEGTFATRYQFVPSQSYAIYRFEDEDAVLVDPERHAEEFARIARVVTALERTLE